MGHYFLRHTELFIEIAFLSNLSSGKVMIKEPEKDPANKIHRILILRDKKLHIQNTDLDFFQIRIRPGQLLSNCGPESK